MQIALYKIFLTGWSEIVLKGIHFGFPTKNDPGQYFCHAFKTSDTFCSSGDKDTDRRWLLAVDMCLFIYCCSRISTCIAHMWECWIFVRLGVAVEIRETAVCRLLVKPDWHGNRIKCTVRYPSAQSHYSSGMRDEELVSLMDNALCHIFIWFLINFLKS